MAEVICTCPKCGGEIRENNKAYGCSNWKENDGSCKVTIWKEICGRAITPEEAKQLLTTGETDVLDGFVSRKTGKTFSAKLVFRDGRAQFEFPPRQ